MKKILLAIQYWHRDRDQAMRVAKLIADLEPQRSQHADFLFAARFDCTQDEEAIRQVSKKFDVHHFINRNRRGTGWPHGCNELWFGVMDWLYSHREADVIPDYKAVLTFEADACPLTPHWIQRLSESWDKAQAKVHGPMLQYPGEHVNGNAMFSGDLKFLEWIARQVGGCSPHGGWDYLLAPEFKRRGWKGCPAMKSWWQHPTLKEGELDKLSETGVVFLHGVKDDSVIDAVRKKYLGGT